MMNTSLRIKRTERKKKRNYQNRKVRNFRKPSQAVPVPRLVSELELEVMSSCLVRLGREVIGSLQANLRYSEARIKGIYKEVLMQQQGYCLHDGAQETQLSSCPAPGSLLC